MNQREIQWNMGNGGGWGMGVRRAACMLLPLYRGCVPYNHCISRRPCVWAPSIMLGQARRFRVFEKGLGDCLCESCELSQEGGL